MGSIKRLVAPALNEVPEFLKTIEAKWKLKLMRRFERERFVGSKEEASTSEKLPRYVLSMFPYPSGRLHLGHVRIYTSSDILARYSKLLSKNSDHPVNYTHVINPMGFDSFGLPAENAAKERGLNPAVWTNSNIRTMKQQLDDLAFQFDWREATSNPSFYKWTQDIFLRLMDANLVYKSYAQVNWDPIDKTVLANEQVDENGRSWRSGALVEKRYYRQWFIKVNAFTHAIYEANDVDPKSWRDILDIQRNWIGKPCGWLFYLKVTKESSQNVDILPVFTKHPELFLSNNAMLSITEDHWLEKIHSVSQKGHISNPFTNEPLKVSIIDKDTDSHAILMPIDESKANLNDNENREKVLSDAKLQNLGAYYTSESYKDWLISRQRFWGTPIPIVRCHDCGFKGVSNKTLPVKLPAIQDFSAKNIPSDKCETSHEVMTPIEQLAPPDWLKTSCPSCGSIAQRECETFDTLFDSSWYFLRYATGPSNDRAFDPDRVQPVWCYIGGKEHASMHLFYARFMTHFLHSLGQLKFKEPFHKLLVQGVVKSKTYKLDSKYLSQSEAESLADKSKLVVVYEKMSKSKGNGVDPQELLDKYGIDATRMCLMSYANPRSERLWRTNEEEFKDVFIYIRRVILTVQEYTDIGDQTGESPLEELSETELDSQKSLIAETRNKSSVDAIYHMQETNQFRQYISVLHVYLNFIRSQMNSSAIYTREFAEALAALIVMLNPITPHLSEELWSHFSNCRINPLRNATDSKYQVSLQASDQPWPIPDNDYELRKMSGKRGRFRKSKSKSIT